MITQGIHIEWAICSGEDWLPRLAVDFMTTDSRKCYEPTNGGHKVMVF
jgi:hypothetical protein